MAGGKVLVKVDGELREFSVRANGLVDTGLGLVPVSELRLWLRTFGFREVEVLGRERPTKQATLC